MEKASINSVLICGAGLAFEMTLAALSAHLPDTIRVIALELEGLDNRDSFYGHLMAPTAYNFLLSLGLDEPNLILNSQTNFAYGTAYESWAGRLNWTQVFHNPFPVWDNIQLHQYVSRTNAPLSPFLVNSVAGLKGRFAHPQGDPQNPLSQAEYGYVFDPIEICKLLKQASKADHIKRLAGRFAKAKFSKEHFISLELTDGQILEADFLIDCSGADTPLISQSERAFDTERELAVIENRSLVTPGITFKHVKSSSTGWESVVRLQRENLNLSVGLPEAMPQSDFKVEIGHSSIPWRNNYLAIGHAACVAEPLTPAPMMLLQRDIERLLNLFPISGKMTVESREYNRLFNDDREHCDLFFRSMFEIADAPASPYWDSVRATHINSKLIRKIEQFESRGYITMYDLEPFNAEDWIIQHFGLGRSPDRKDIYLDQVPVESIRQRLGQLSANIDSIVQKIPPTDRYIQRFRRYLKEKHGG